mmetsp:Transcript_73537/g.209308  ORF Transcript_73537/g.209308 Transcript_73537/m.209308 type:complete len:222 (+) Transcript_73537:886-1551(+)
MGRAVGLRLGGDCSARLNRMVVYNSGGQQLTSRNFVPSQPLHLRKQKGELVLVQSKQVLVHLHRKADACPPAVFGRLVPVCAERREHRWRTSDIIFVWCKVGVLDEARAPELSAVHGILSDVLLLVVPFERGIETHCLPEVGLLEVRVKHCTVKDRTAELGELAHAAAEVGMAQSCQLEVHPQTFIAGERKSSQIVAGEVGCRAAIQVCALKAAVPPFKLH